MLSIELIAKPRKQVLLGSFYPYVLFQFQQFPFHLQSAGVTGERTVFANNPMTWNQQPDGISVAGHTDGSGSAGFSDGGSNFSVGSGLPVGDLHQFLPDKQLKWSTSGCKGKVKAGSGTTEIFLQLRKHGLGDGIGQVFLWKIIG